MYSPLKHGGSKCVYIAGYQFFLLRGRSRKGITIDCGENNVHEKHIVLHTSRK